MTRGAKRTVRLTASIVSTALAIACANGPREPSLTAAVAEDEPPEPAGTDAGEREEATHDSLPVGLRCLRDAYPDSIADVETEPETGRLRVRMAGGAVVPWDDGRAGKSFEEKLARPDLEDQMSIPYPRDWPDAPPAPGEDPGRIRVRAFFEAIYGDTDEDVRATLVRVPWPGGRSVRFTSTNGAAKALERVSTSLAAKLTAETRSFVTPPGGTYNRRPIAGTDRPSAHSWGIAIDINTARSDYWRWSGGAAPLSYRNRVLRGVVERFEREGFVWGGKWHHYDTMHFEYRPELLDLRCAARRSDTAGPSMPPAPSTRPLSLVRD